jgi:uncharacterized phage infection (PIP) family protein YhgE
MVRRHLCTSDGEDDDGYLSHGGSCDELAVAFGSQDLESFDPELLPDDSGLSFQSDQKRISDQEEEEEEEAEAEDEAEDENNDTDYLSELEEVNIDNDDEDFIPTTKSISSLPENPKKRKSINPPPSKLHKLSKTLPSRTEGSRVPLRALGQPNRPYSLGLHTARSTIGIGLQVGATISS